MSSAPGFAPYSSVLYECYLGLPQQNKAAYDAANLLLPAPNLDGAFRLACGTCDHATWTDAIKMTEALIRAGKDHEFVAQPDQYHGFGSSHDSYLRRKAARFFAERLGAAEG